MRFKQHVLAIFLLPVLGVPLAACDRPGTCDAMTLTVTGVDAGGRGGSGRSSGGKSGKSSGKSKVTTGGGGSHSDDCDDD